MPRPFTYRTPQDHARARASLAKLGRTLDARWYVPSLDLRFGWDALIGLVPIVGDVVMALVATIIVCKAYRLRAPKRILALMLGNVLIDVVIGGVPGVGDIADFFFKANQRNLALLNINLASPLDRSNGHSPANRPTPPTSPRPPTAPSSSPATPEQSPTLLP